MTIERRIFVTLLAALIELPLLWLLVYGVLGALISVDPFLYTARVAAGILCGLVFMVICIGWTLSGMKWRRSAARSFLNRLLLSAIVAVLIGMIVADREGPVVAIIAFVILCLVITFVALPKLPAEAILPPPKRRLLEGDVCCPTCGYSMRGLYKSQCPECGGLFTLDELFTQNISKSK